MPVCRSLADTKYEYLNPVDIKFNNSPLITPYLGYRYVEPKCSSSYKISNQFY